MARSFRAVLLALVALSLLPGLTSAAGQTIGARISPVPLVVERQPWVAVTNLSALRLGVKLEIIGEGYALESSGFSLDPGQRRVTNLARIGPGEATIRAHLHALNLKAGVETVDLVLETRARHESLAEVVERAGVPVAGLAALGLLALLTALLLVWRRRRHAS